MRVKDARVNRQRFNAVVVIVVDHFPQKCSHQTSPYTILCYGLLLSCMVIGMCALRIILRYSWSTMNNTSFFHIHTH